MRPIRVWLSAAVCGFALIVIAGSGPPLQAEEPRERVREDRAPEVKEHREGERVDRERQEREHQTREAEARKHRETEDRDRDDRDHDDRDREAHDRDDDDDEDDDHARPNPHDGDRPHDGPTDVRNSVNDELLDLARALRRIDQSYGFRGIQGCGSWTAGSAYMDWDARGFGNRPHPPDGARSGPLRGPLLPRGVPRPPHLRRLRSGLPSAWTAELRLCPAPSTADPERMS